jgi:hypothetical protein
MQPNYQALHLHLLACEVREYYPSPKIVSIWEKYYKNILLRFSLTYVIAILISSRYIFLPPEKKTAQAGFEIKMSENLE